MAAIMVSTEDRELFIADYAPAPGLLDDRNILVTGAGSGLGAAAAKACARYGATLILLGRSVGDLEQVYDEIEAAGGNQPAIYPLDLEGAREADYNEVAQRLQQAFGRLDGLLHNAAFMGTRTPFEHYSAELWYRVFQVNVHASFLLTRACLPLLQRSRDGRILFTSAEVGRHGHAYWGPYGASKAALENMMETLAAELQNTSVRVNSIDPGAVRTAMRTSAFPGENPEHLPTPDEVMSMYLYALGPDSREITGRRLNAQPN